MSRLEGRRLSHLTGAELPQLATALVSYFRGNARVGVGQFRGRRFVRIVGVNTDVIVLADDWAKLESLIKDGSLGMAATGPGDNDFAHARVLSVVACAFANLQIQGPCHEH